MDFNLREHTILLTVAGSRAYGIHLPTSDVDVKGICIPPAKYYLGCLDRFEQADKPSHMASFLDCMNEEERKVIAAEKLEGTVFELQKFMDLAMQGNPNILDALFCRDAEVRVQTPLGKLLRENRALFISAKCKFTFSGYAIAQLKRIKGHRAWLLHPPDHKPTRDEFGLPEHTLIPADQLAAAQATVKKQIDGWEWDLQGAEPALIEFVQEQFATKLAEVQTALGYPNPEEAKWLAAARIVGLDDNLIYVLQKEREYEAASRYYKQYEEWKRGRNPARAALEAKFGYDCYLEDTEFLTDTGWKTFDAITEGDSLATVYIKEPNTLHKWGALEYQHFTERFDGTFTGNLYHFTGTHTDTMVTPNHRMLMRPVEKNTRRKSEWSLEEASRLPNCFEVLRTATPRLKSYCNRNLFTGLPIPDRAYMTLMGWLLSDGTFSFRSNGSVKSARISQKRGGRLSWSMSRFHGDYGDKISSSIYDYERKPTGIRPYKIVEHILDIRDPALVQRLYADCGHCKNKRIPRWVFGLSVRLMEKLFDAMVGGDGTERNTNLKSIIYYTSLEGLADDIQELAIHCGWETSKWGPYPGTEINPNCEMWQIHVNKNTTQFKELDRSQNIEKMPVTKARIVCFSVPNGTLVTRRKGNVSFHGNCKHAGHLVRLLRMGREILETGKVHVWRGSEDGGPGDAEEIRAIRNGAWTYEQIVEWAEAQDEVLNRIYNEKTYVVPKQPNREALNALCIELIQRALKG